MRLAFKLRSLALEPWLEKFRRVEVVLDISNDLRGTYGGRFVDGCEDVIRMQETGHGMEWNHTVPRTPSRIGPDMVVMMPGDKTVADEEEDAFLRLRQTSSRPPMR